LTPSNEEIKVRYRETYEISPSLADCLDPQLIQDLDLSKLFWGQAHRTSLRFLPQSAQVPLAILQQPDLAGKYCQWLSVSKGLES